MGLVRRGLESTIDRLDGVDGQRRREPVPGVAVGQPMHDQRGEAGLVRQVLTRALAQARLDGCADGGLRLADGDWRQGVSINGCLMRSGVACLTLRFAEDSSRFGGRTPTGIPETANGGRWRRTSAVL